MRRFFASISTSAVQTIVSGVTGLVLARLFIQAFGLELYGVWVACAAWTGYLTLTQLGISTAVGIRVARQHAHHRFEEASEDIATACVSLSAIAVAASTAVLIASQYPQVLTRVFGISSTVKSEDVAAIFLLASIAFLAALPAEPFRSSLRWLNRIDIEQSLIVASRLLTVILAWISLSLFRTPFAFLLSQLIAAVILAFAVYFSVSRLFPSLRFHISRFRYTNLVDLLRPSGAFLLIGASGAVIWSTDPLVIAMFVGAAEVAPFALALRVVQLSTLGIAVLIGASVPVFAKFTAADDAQRSRLYLELLRITMLSSIGAVILMAFFAKSFVSLWVGMPVFVSVMTFSVFLVTFTVRTFAMAAESIVVTGGGEQGYGRVVAIEAILNLVLSISLAPLLGVFGVALGTLLAHIVGTGWYLPWTAKRMTKMTVPTLLHQVFAPLIVPSLVAIAVGGLLTPFDVTWPRFLACLLTTAAAYGLTWICISSNEWENSMVLRFLGSVGVRNTTSVGG